MSFCNGWNRDGKITPRESGQTSAWSFMTRTLEKTTKEEKQMTAENQPAGASFHGVMDWSAIDWQQAHHTVRRLQARIVKATQEGRWGKVKALQRLLTHSFSGKALAVRRVTENQGKHTPGVDKITWNTPHNKINAVYSLRQSGHHPQPLRRIYIPKKNGKKRPLGIPIWAVHYPSFQAMFGIPWVLLPMDRSSRSTVITLLYHNLPNITSTSVLPVPFNGLAQGLDDLGRERNPTRPQRGGANTVQKSRLAPVGDRGDIHIEQFGGSFGRIAPISPLPSWCGFRTFWASSRDVIGVANPLDFADRKRASHASPLSFLIQEGGNLRIGVRRRQRPHALDHLRTRLAFFPRHFVARDGKTREGLGLPPNSDVDDVAPLGERHILDQPAQQLLALGKGGGGSVPDSWQVVGKLADLLSLRGSERESRRFGPQSIFPFQLFNLGQFLIPFALQTPGYQAIVRVDSLVASPGQVRLILRPLDLPLPLLIDLPGTRFQRIERRESYLQMGGLNGLQKALHHSLIDPISAHGLAGFGGQLPVGLVTFVQQQRAIALIAYAHPSATGATQDNPLQQRWPLANGSTMVFSPPGAVIVELPLVAQQLVPRNVTRMLIQQHNRPFLLWETTRSPFDTGFFSRQGAAAELGAPVDVGACIQRAMQDIQDPSVCEPSPDQFICLLASPPACRETQVLFGKVHHDCKRRAKLLKERKDQAHRFLHGLIRVEHDPAGWIVDQANGQTKAQSPLFRFGHLSPKQPTFQPMELGLRHAALEPQQQPILMQSRIVDAFFVHHQRVRSSADF